MNQVGRGLKIRSVVPIIGAALLIAACGSSSTSGGSSAASGTKPGGKITIADFGGPIDAGIKQAFVPGFQQQTGASVTTDPSDAYPKEVLQARTGNVYWNLIEADGWQIKAWCGKVIQPYPSGSVPTSGFYSSLIDDNCGIPLLQYPMLLSYDSTKLNGAPPPTSWADFFNTTKYPGKRCGYNNPVQNLELGLLAQGVPPSKLYPLNVKKSLAEWQKIKGDVVLNADPGQLTSMMLSGNYVMCATLSGRGFAADSQGGHWVPVWNQNIRAWDDLGITKGGPHVATAVAFLKYLATHPAADARFSEISTYGNTLQAAKPRFSKLAGEWAMTVPSHYAHGFTINSAYWATHNVALTDAWNAAQQ